MLLKQRPYTINPIKQILDNIPKSILSKRAMIPLILSGILGDRVKVYEEYMEYRKEEPVTLLKIHKTLAIDLYDEDYIVEEQLLKEAYICSPINNLSYIDYKAIKNNNTFNTTIVVKRVTTKRDKNNNMMAFMTLLASCGNIEAVVFANQYKDYKRILKKNNILKINARKQDDNGCILIKADKI